MSNEEEKPELITKISRLIPSIEKPLYKQQFDTRIKWTGIALILYMTLSYITVYGVSQTSYEQFRFYEIVLGSKFGSIMTLGIGPIVTAGIILQLLVGSKIISWDMTKPESRKRFQTWNKVLAIAFTFIEATAYVLVGALPIGNTFLGNVGTVVFVILQISMGGVIVIFLDDLVSKWGFGSGVSLFIAAGVTTQILIRILSPLAAGCVAWQFSDCIPSEGKLPVGLIWLFLINLLTGETWQNILMSVLPIFSTIFVFLLVIYAQHIKVDIPLAFSALRGFGRAWSLKLFYTSNIPVILTAALLANVQLMGRVGIVVDEKGMSCGLMGCFDDKGNPTSGVAYLLSSPSNLLMDLITLNIVPSEILRAFTYLLAMILGSMMFSIFWVNTAGMDAKSLSRQIESIGMQIPGYRRDPRIIESVLNRYIPSLAILGGLAVGLLAATADFIGAIGTGTGILLTVMIIYNYYEELKNQKLEEAHPWIRKFFGE